MNRGLIVFHRGGASPFCPHSLHTPPSRPRLHHNKKGPQHLASQGGTAFANFFMNVLAFASSSGLKPLWARARTSSLDTVRSSSLGAIFSGKTHSPSSPLMTCAASAAYTDECLFPSSTAIHLAASLECCGPRPLSRKKAKKCLPYVGSHLFRTKRLAVTGSSLGVHGSEGAYPLSQLGGKLVLDRELCRPLFPNRVLDELFPDRDGS